jgi:hypothetical protein
MKEIMPLQGEDLLLKFQGLIGYSRGGELTIVTPFISDFEIRGKTISSHMMVLARSITKISLMVAPPMVPHKDKFHSGKDYLHCDRCKSTAKKIALLDIYEKFSKEILIKENLHAKMYIAKNYKGNHICLAGSANLTLGGFQEYCELCFYISDKLIIRKLFQFYNIWKSGSHGPRAELYRIWKAEYLKEYPHIQEILEMR